MGETVLLALRRAAWTILMLIAHDDEYLLTLRGPGETYRLVSECTRDVENLRGLMQSWLYFANGAITLKGTTLSKRIAVLSFLRPSTHRQPYLLELDGPPPDSLLISSIPCPPPAPPSHLAMAPASRLPTLVSTIHRYTLSSTILINHNHLCRQPQRFPSV